MYPDFRRMRESDIRREMQTMDEQTLNRAMDGRGGPRINPHQKSLLRDEIDQRRLDREHATQMAIEANQNISNFESIDTGRAVGTLDEPGFDPLVRDTGPSSVEMGDDGGNLEPEYENFSNNLSRGSPDRSKPEPQDDEREALLLIGAILYEAALIKRTEDTIQAQINHSSEFYITDSSLPKQITELLWTEYDADNRIRQLRSILGTDTAAAIDTIESLVDEVAK